MRSYPNMTPDKLLSHNFPRTRSKLKRLSVNFKKRISKQRIAWSEVYKVQFRIAAQNYERTPLNKGLGLKQPLNPCIVFLTPQSLETHFEAKRVSEYPKMCLSAQNCVKRTANQVTDTTNPEMPKNHPTRFLIQILAIDCIRHGFQKETGLSPARLFPKP